MIPAHVQIVVCAEPVDMRYGFDRLAQKVRELGGDPESGSLFVFAAAPSLKGEALLGGLLLGAGVVLRPVYYAYQQYVLMEAMASLGGFGVSGGTLEPMIAEILLAFGIAYLVGVTALRKPAVTWWVFALSVAIGAWMATRNFFKPDGLLLAAVACVVASLAVLAHAQHAARQLRR